MRAWNLSAREIRREGVLFSLYKGATLAGLETLMSLVLWPGYGVKSAGMHTGYTDPEQLAAVHTHRVSDEVLLNLFAPGQAYCGDRWLAEGSWDVLLAPCGVHHSVGGSRDAADGRSGGVGFASPPQLDLYARASYYEDGKFDEPCWETLEAKTARCATFRENPY